MKSEMNKDIQDLMKRVVKLEKVPNEVEEKVTKSAVQDLDTRVMKIEENPYIKDDLAKDSVKQNIVLRNVKESSNENLVNKVSAILREGCKVKEVTVTKAVRKGKSYNGKPPVIVATLGSKDEVSNVLEAKSVLKQSWNHKNVFIHADMDIESRIMQSNTMAMLKAVGKDKEFMFKGKSLVKRNQTKE